jgi:tetratricopeptide (TPR) repeat protein
MVQVWDARTAQPLWKSEVVGWYMSLAVSPDGKWLAQTEAELPTHLWDLDTGKIIRELPHPSSARSPAFSPDSRWLATACGDSLARIWEVPGGKLRLTIRHASMVSAVAFSPDGRRLVTADRGDNLRVWDAATGEPTTPVFPAPGSVSTVAFSPDGRWVLAGTREASSKAWDAATGEPLGPPWPTLGSYVEPAFRPDGRQVLFEGSDSPTQLWDFTSERRSAGEWRLRAEAQTGCHIDTTGAVTALSPAEVVAAWDRLRQHEPQALRLPPEQVRSWYVGEAWRLKRAGHTADALAVLGEAVAESPDDPDLLGRRGLLAAHLRQTDLARQDLAKAARQDATLWMEMARVCDRGSRRAEGIELLSERLEAEPDNGALWLARGWLYVQDGKRALALHDLTEALKRDADADGWAFVERGRMSAEQGQWPAARDDFAAAVQRQPLNVPWQLEYAWTLLALNDRPALARVFAGLFPDLSPEPGSAAAVRVARLAVVLPAGVIDPGYTSGRLLPSGAQDGGTRTVRGGLLLRAGKFAEAVAELQQAVARREADEPPVAELLLAVALQRQQGKAEDARRALERARFALGEATVAQAIHLFGGGTGGPLTAVAAGGAMQPSSTARWGWQAQLELRLLRQEAGALLEPKSDRPGP